MNQKDTERFRERYKTNPKTGCWDWLSTKDRDGYGQFKLNGKQWKAHRLSWTLYLGEIPEKLFVCHRCDNPGCVNPEHLFLGTAMDNNRDTVEKGRDRKASGKNNGHARITEIDVLEIRRLYATGDYTYNQLADVFGLKGSHVWKIVQKKLWRDIPYDVRSI